MRKLRLESCDLPETIELASWAMLILQIHLSVNIVQQFVWIFKLKVL